VKAKVKKVKFSVAQECFSFVENAVFKAPANLGNGQEARFDAMFDSRSWVKDLLERPVSAREVNS